MVSQRAEKRRRIVPCAVWRVASWVAGVAVALATPGWAAPILPSPHTLAHCDIGNSNVLDDPTSCSLGTVDTAFASLTLSPFVSLVARAEAPIGPGNHGAGANASVTYSFQVTGGNPGDIVPILIATNLNTTGTQPTLAIGFAALDVTTSAAGSATLMAVCSDGSCGTTARAFSGTLRTRAKSGDLDELTLRVQAAVVGNNLLSESATASADPFIFVDPAFPDASLYSIVVSPGVGNTPAVPEPAACVIVIVGLSAMRWVRRRHSGA